MLSVFSFIDIKAQDPGWSVDYSQFTFRMTVSAIVEKDGTLLGQGANQVAVFFGDEIRGLGKLDLYHEPSDRYLAVFQVGSNSSVSEELTVKIYDETKNEVVESRVGVTFTPDQLVGSVTDPVIFSDNRYPTDILIETLEFKENSREGTLISLISTSDEDDSDYNYSLQNFSPEVAATSIKINHDSLLVSEPIDFETTDQFLFSITATDASGVNFSKQFTMIILDEFEDPDAPPTSVEEAVFEGLPISNYISPNGDGINDYLTIGNHHIYDDFLLKIVNPKGKTIYSKLNYDNSWNGKYEGKSLPTGVYFYFFENKNKGVRFDGRIYIKER